LQSVENKRITSQGQQSKLTKQQTQNVDVLECRSWFSRGSILSKLSPIVTHRKKIK